MKNTLLTLAAAFGLLGSLLVQANESGKSIFNGKDLTGWKAPEGNIWWIVEDGILKVRSGPDQKGSILWSKKEFTDFAVTLDFKFGEGIIDSGVHVKSQDQIQIGISGSLKRDMTASPYIPGKGYPVEAEGVKELLQMDDWNTLKIEVKGMTYTSYLNGKKVMTYTSESGKEKGPIGLQLHGKRDMSIDFRKIKVKELK
jgi:hypothetical protein